MFVNEHNGDVVPGAWCNKMGALLLFLIVSVIAAETPYASAANLFISFSEGGLTVKAVDVSLKDLIEEIGKKSGIVVELRDQKAAEKHLTLDLVNASPGRAFEEILRGFSFVFFYNRARLAQVIVLSPDGPPPQGFISRPSPTRPPLGPKAVRSDPVPDFEELLERNRAEGMKALSEALENPDPEVKRSALEALVDTEGPDVIPLLSRALRDQDPSFRMEVLEALADKRELQLVRGALSDQNEEVREKAADLLEIEGEEGERKP